jgi:hypothetical protein
VRPIGVDLLNHPVAVVVMSFDIQVR